MKSWCLDMGRRLVAAWREHPWGRRTLLLLFMATMVYWLVRLGMEVPWSKVWQASLETPASSLALACAMVMGSYAIYAAFDLIGKRVTRHTLPAQSVLTVAGVCYAVNQNLGYLVGGLALRGRLYGRLGLDMSTVGVVVGTSVLSNWMGYLALLGVLLVAAPLPLPSDWPVNLLALRVIGGLGLLACMGYVLACAFSPWREWEVGKAQVRLPSWTVAVVQLTSSATHWLFMAGVIWAVLPEGTSYAPVATTFLLASLAGVVAHVPAGVGVLEAIFAAMLGSEALPVPTLLAAVLIFRAVYQWLPGLLSVVGYVVLERAPVEWLRGGGQDNNEKRAATPASA